MVLILNSFRFRFIFIMDDLDLISNDLVIKSELILIFFLKQELILISIINLGESKIRQLTSLLLTNHLTHPNPADAVAAQPAPRPPSPSRDTAQPAITLGLYYLSQRRRSYCRPVVSFALVAATSCCVSFLRMRARQQSPNSALVCGHSLRNYCLTNI